MEIKRNYGKEWDKIIKRNRKLIYEIPEPTAYWIFQIVETFKECNWEKMSDRDKRYVAEFLKILKSKLKLRDRSM